MNHYTRSALRRNNRQLRYRARLRSLRAEGPRYVHARRSKRCTSVWTLRARRLSPEARA
jgi:hypothetical protein